MDLLTVLFVLIVLMVLVFARIIRSPSSVGKQGESRVNSGLTRLLDENTYQLFDDVTFPVRDMTVQIDHLVVSPYGLFVIETKNMKGWIFGTADHARWTQVIYRFKNGFQNPIQQNAMHVRTVCDLLGIHPEYAHNAVIFVGPSCFKTPMPEEVWEDVAELASFIKSKNVPVFSTYELDRISRWIQEKRLEPGAATDNTHIENVEKAILEKTKRLENSCPRCGGQLVERRNAQTGDSFLGCKKFPRCRGSRSLQ